jgi:hypothetical protein
MKKAIIVLIIGMFLFSGCTYDTIVENPSEINVKSENSSVDVYIQDDTSQLESFYLIDVLYEGTFTNNISIDDNEIGSTDTNFCDVGDAINIYDDYELFQALITSVNVTHYKFTPVIDKEFLANESYYECGPYNMNVSGSISDPVTYSIHPPEKTNWQIKTNIINLVDTSPMDSLTFGSRPALENGFLLRRKNGVYNNLFMIYNNNGFTNRGYDYLSIPKALSDYYEASFRMNFQDVMGVYIQLNGSLRDTFQVIVYDDLRSQEEVVSTIGGHRVVD